MYVDTKLRRVFPSRKSTEVEEGVTEVGAVQEYRTETGNILGGTEAERGRVHTERQTR